MMKNDRCAWIAIFTIERYWADAVNMKKQLSDKKASERVKYHILKKMKKAASSVAAFVRAAESTLDKSSNVELKAYHDFMVGQKLIEEKDFGNALELLVQSEIIYDKIAASKDSLQAIVYTEMVESLAPLIRLC